jgi:hypothetical protein
MTASSDSIHEGCILTGSLFTEPMCLETARYALGELLRVTSDHILMLTARSHKGDPANFSLFLQLLKQDAYAEFEDRMGRIRSPRGAKTGLIEKAVRDFSPDFSVSDLERACPDVSRDMVRRVLRDLQAKGDVECIGRGPGALWRKREKR